MATTLISPRFLPQNPSEEYLRKQAKRLARADDLQLGAAQRRLAHEYGYRSWAGLMTAVQAMASPNGTGSGAGSSRVPDSPPTREPASNVFPLLPLRGLVAFPHVSYPIFVGRPMSMKSVAHAKEHDLSLLLVTQRDAVVTEPTISDIYEVGTIAAVVETLRLPDGTFRIAVEGRRRARLNRLILDQEFFKAEAEGIEEPVVSDTRLESVTRSVLSALLRERLRNVPEGVNWPTAFAVAATSTDGASVLADRIASETRMDLASKQALLQIFNPLERLQTLLAYFNGLS
jgi:ATP-dependent Lon protease